MTEDNPLGPAFDHFMLNPGDHDAFIKVHGAIVDARQDILDDYGQVKWKDRELDRRRDAIRKRLELLSRVHQRIKPLLADVLTERQENRSFRDRIDARRAKVNQLVEQVKIARKRATGEGELLN